MSTRLGCLALGISDIAGFAKGHSFPHCCPGGAARLRGELTDFSAASPKMVRAPGRHYQ